MMKRKLRSGRVGKAVAARRRHSRTGAGRAGRRLRVRRRTAGIVGKTKVPRQAQQPSRPPANSQTRLRQAPWPQAGEEISNQIQQRL